MSDVSPSYDYGTHGEGIDLDTLDYFEQVILDLPRTYEKAVKHAAKVHTGRFKEVLTAQPEWDTDSTVVKVQPVRGGIEYSVQAENVDALEYGDLSNAPSPLLRTFVLHDTDAFSETVSQYLKENL